MALSLCISAWTISNLMKTLPESYTCSQERTRSQLSWKGVPCFQSWVQSQVSTSFSLIRSPAISPHLQLTVACTLQVYPCERLVLRKKNYMYRAVSDLLAGIPRVQVYSADILVFGRDAKKHDEPMKAVLRRLNDANLRLYWQMCHVSPQHRLQEGVIYPTS